MAGLPEPLHPSQRKAIILGLPLLAIRSEDLPALCETWVASKKTAHVALGTLPLAVACERDIALQRLLTEADAVLCGGSGLAWAARRLNAPQPCILDGSSLVTALAGIAAARGWKIALLGPDRAPLSAVSKILKQRHPALPEPFLAAGESGASGTARRDLEAAGPDLLLVGLPPEQAARWFGESLPWLRVPLVVAVNDGFASLSGLDRSAFRTPWTSLAFHSVRLFFWVGKMRRQRGRLRLAPSASSSAATRSKGPGVTTCVWVGPVVAASVSGLPAAEVARDASGLVLDLEAVTLMDSCGLGHLIHAHRRAKAAGAGFVLLAPSPAVRSLLAVTKLDNLLTFASTFEEASKLCLAQTPRFMAGPNPSAEEELVLHCQGDVSAAGIDAASRWLADEWQRHPGARHLVLDFSHVRFVDSSGLGWLLQARGLARQREGNFSLRHTGGQPARLLAQTRLTHVFSVT